MSSGDTKNEILGSVCSIILPKIQFTKSLNGADKNTQLNGDSLILKSDGKTDFFNSPDGHYLSSTAPMLLSKVDNTQEFTITSKATPSLKEKYDAAALYVYVDNNLWHKFAYERDDVNTNRIVTVRTNETSDDCNHQPINDHSVFLKISSDTKTVAFYFSIDGLKWTLVRLYKNNYPEIIWLGLSAQSPMGQGNLVKFENTSLVNESVKDFRLGV